MRLMLKLNNFFKILSNNRRNINMAIVESEVKKDIQSTEEKEDKILYNVFPDMRRHIDYKNRRIEFEVSLPGVKKEDIKLKSLPKWFHLEAKRGHLMYSANQNFGKEIVPDKTTAKYENGLLTIKAKIPDPFDGAKEITF